MKIMISGEQPFQVLSDNFSISPSNEGYTLQISADGIEFSDLFAVAADTTRMVTDVANGSYYRLAGNASDVTVNWNRSCGGGEGGGGGEYVLPKASATRLGGVKVGANLSIDANGVLSATGGGGGSVPTFDLDVIFAMSDEEKAAMFPTIKSAIESGSFIAYGTLESEGGTLCFANKAAVEGDDRVFFECYGSHYSQPSTIMVRTYRLWSDGNAATEDFSATVGGGGSSQPSVYFIEFQERTATGGDADWVKLDEMYNRAAAGDFGFILNVKYDGVAIGNLIPWEAYNEDYNGNGVRFHFMYVNSDGKVEYGNHSDWSDFMVFKNEDAHTIRCEKISKTIENGGSNYGEFGGSYITINSDGDIVGGDVYGVMRVFGDPSDTKYYVLAPRPIQYKEQAPWGDEVVVSTGNFTFSERDFTPVSEGEEWNDKFIATGEIKINGVIYEGKWKLFGDSSTEKVYFQPKVG